MKLDEERKSVKINTPARFLSLTVVGFDFDVCNYGVSVEEVVDFHSMGLGPRH